MNAVARLSLMTQPPRPPAGGASNRHASSNSDVVRISFSINKQHAPALRSAIEEISNEVGGRLEGPFSFATEQALTDAAVGLGVLRAAINKVVPAGDPNYHTR